MQLHEYAKYDAVGLRTLIEAGEVTAGEVEAAARQALDQVNPHVNGLALPPFQPALGHAGDGPLTGVPFLIKDHGPVAEGVPFSLGSRALPGIPAWRDTDLMTRFRAAGLVTLGLTTVPELCVSFSTEPLRHGPARNPWNPGRGVGGSSGGAAALVAAGAVPVAHASDGAGSIRIPASCCGLVGLKPSRGRVPCGPDAGEPMLGMAYEFALTRTVRDAARLLDAVHGPGVGDKYTAPPPRGPYAAEVGRDPGRLRVAVTTESWAGTAVDAEVAAAAVRAGQALERAGHLVTTAGPAVVWDDVVRAWVCESVAIASTLLLAPRRPDEGLMEAVSRQFLKTAEEYSALDMLAAFDAQNRVSRAVGAFFTGYDLLVTPTLGRLPAPHGVLRYDDPEQTLTGWLAALTEYGPFTQVFNVTGGPAISLPLGHSEDGLPIGVQLAAGYGREDLLLQVAAHLEEALPWRDRVPPIHAGGR
ncbi:amidase family protein [Actinomadura sp. ATCC 31491]|uniref:Amidase family protein n=1 Tax=Actinomadura luzonensis TaxID=2805427 RepID=A0ABT0G2Z0_9ACTN|nr:amidase family protein [Actinomadura luzonensis]MCK2218778.1 amidase family protein [Actinomadura luzonensis]